jgi:hypothetical protein
MAAEIDLYTIRYKGDGFTLEGPLLAHSLIYERASDAFSYAKNHLAPVPRRTDRSL